MKVAQRSEWPTVAIAELGDVVTGRTPPCSRPECFGDRYPFITPSDMDGRKFMRMTERSLSEEGAGLLRSNRIPPGCVTVSCIGWQMGKVAMTAAESFTNQQLNTIIQNRDVCADFLYYSLLPRKEELLSLGASTGVRTPILNKTAFTQLRIPLPPLPVQRRIASILGAYDDLIENNLRRITILEQMAQAIYREWFVEFRAPGVQLRKATAEEKKVTGKDVMPKGWEVVALKSLVHYARDSVQPGPEAESVPYVPIDILPRKSLALAERRPGVEAQSSLISFCKGDILFGAMRSYFHKVVIAPFDGTTRSTCFILRPRDPDYHAYAVLLAFQESSVDYASQHSRGATMPYAVWNGSFAEMPVLRPERHVAVEFENLVRPILGRIVAMFFEQQNLRRTRDLLLPRLVAGELSLKRSLRAS